MAAVGVFAVLDDDAAVEEGGAEGPEDVGEAGRGEEVVDRDFDFGFLHG